MWIPPDRWREITPDVRRLWVPGVWSLVHRTSGRRYICAADSVGKRVRDHHAALQDGRHWNPELQADWSADPEGFGWFLVQTTSRRWTRQILKQGAIDEAWREGLSYNKRRAYARTPTPSSQAVVK